MKTDKKNPSIKRSIAFLIAGILATASVSQLFAGPYESGRAYYRAKKYDKARASFLKSAKETDLGDAYYFLGEIEKLEGNYSNAEEYYLIAISKKSTSPQYLKNAYWSAVVLAESRNDTVSMVKICREWWSRTGDRGAKVKIESIINKSLWTESEKAINEYNSAMNLKKRGHLEEAVQKFKSALTEDNSFLAPKFELGMIAFESGDLDDASSYLSDVESRIPIYGEVHLVLGNIYQRMKNFSKAVYHYTKVLEIGFMDKETSNGIRINLAISLYKIGDYQKALDDLTKISPKGDNKHREILLLSAINIKLNKIDEAIELLQKALSQNPKKPSILYQLGSLYHRENDQKYILYFDKLFDIASRRKKIPSKYLQSFALLARGHFEKKHYDRVIEIAEFLGKERMNGDIKLIFAKSSYYKGSYETAAQLFEESNLAGDDKLLMCKTYIRLGKTDRAKSALIDYINNTSDSASRIKTDQELKTLYNTIESQNRQTAP